MKNIQKKTLLENFANLCIVCARQYSMGDDYIYLIWLSIRSNRRL